MSTVWTAPPTSLKSSPIIADCVFFSILLMKLFTRYALPLWIGSLLSISLSAQEKPNILLIVSEDNGPELGCYGDPYVKTPVLDSMAKHGVRFENAFVPYSVCSPSRACFLSGLGPQENGHLGLATHKFSFYEDIPHAFSLMKKGGYRTGIIGKLHVNPESYFEPYIDFRAIRSANFGRKKMGAYTVEAAKFFNAGDKPFFLSINYPDAHFPLIAEAGGLPKKKDLLTGKDVKPLPWVAVDSPRLREATANYYNCMSRLDTMIGDLINELKKAGKADNTLIIYIGDHGAQFSRGKTSVYEAGLRIPFIVYWPNQVKPGLVRRELVSSLDILPTMLQAAGIEAPENLSGLPLQAILSGEKEVKWRKYITGIATGSAPSLDFVQFSLRDDRYKLIITPEGQGVNRCAKGYLKHLNAHFIAGCTQAEIDASPAAIRAAYETYMNPPKYELYDLSKDPHEFSNLADNPEYASTLKQLQNAYVEWQKEVKDPFLDPKNIDLWIKEQGKGRKVNYRRDKSFKWEYLDSFKKWRETH